MPILHLDYETFSTIDLTEVGAYRYAAHADTEPLMAAVAVDNEDPLLFIPELYDPGFAKNEDVRTLLRELLPREDTTIFAHNAQFEVAISRYHWHAFFGDDVPMPDILQWRCTAALARRAGLRHRLAEIGEDLELKQQKDKRGGELIKTFSGMQKPRKGEPFRIYPWDRPEEFQAFGEYCIQDVVTEREVHKALKAFDLKGSCLKHFQFDMTINDRGLPVNVDALKKAQVIYEEASVGMRQQFREMTGLNQTQREKVKAWLQARGYPFENMQAMSVENALEDTRWADTGEGAAGEDHRQFTLDVLGLYSDLSYSAVSKIGTMLNCECGDGYVRGALMYYGASTGRWSGRLIQPQNFKRPTVKGTAIAYQMIQDGCTMEELSMVFGNPIEVLSSCIRHFIHPHAGQFLQADYAAVEARIVCWLAGQEDALDEYRRGIDRYKLMATKIYGIKLEEVDDRQRWVGKQSVLGCGFQLWWPGFQAQCAKYGVEVDDETSENAVVSYRDKHAKVVSLWKACDDAAKRSIVEPGKWCKAGPKLAFATTHVKSAKMDFMFLRLPSGRMLAYPKPAITKVRKKFGEKSRVVDQVTFYGALPKTVKWGRASTYGGKLCENATQAVAADLMANGSVEAERRGIQIATLIHDEALAYEHPKLGLDDFIDALCTLPEWAEGLPLVAEGKIIPYYLKA